MAEFPLVRLGRHETKKTTVSLPLEKNMLTIAGAGAGKGATLIMPNLLEWQHNAVVIDPSGEAARDSWEARAKLGQTVAVLAPFGRSGIPERLFASFNPLDHVRDVRTLRAIAKGLIPRSASEGNPHWKSSATKALSGLLAWVLEDPLLDDNERNLGRLLDYVASLQDSTDKPQFLEEMKKATAFGGLAARTAKRLTPDNTEVQNIVGVLDTDLQWLDTTEMVDLLSRTGFQDGRSFDLEDLKNGKLTLYLVLPGDELDTLGTFLRLFVQLTISTMMRETPDGRDLGERCLLMLDEAAAVGRLNEYLSGSGQTRKYGLHFWGFFQSIGQVRELYGHNGFETLSEDADGLTISGASGVEVLEYASRRLGVFKESDIAEELEEIHEEQAQLASTPHPQAPQFVQKGQDDPLGRSRVRTSELSDMERGRRNAAEVSRFEFERFMSDKARGRSAELSGKEQILRARLGKPYYAPDDLREEIGKADGETLPDKMLVFTKTSWSFVIPVPWWDLGEKAWWKWKKETPSPKTTENDISTPSSEVTIEWHDARAAPARRAIWAMLSVVSILVAIGWAIFLF